MAILKNDMLQHPSGTINDVVYKKYYDKTVISKKPDMSNRVLSPKQVETNRRIKCATIYAKSAYRSETEKMQARIRLKVPAHKSVFYAMVKEHFAANKHIPIEQVELEINKLLIEAAN